MKNLRSEALRAYSELSVQLTQVFLSCTFIGGRLSPAFLHTSAPAMPELPGIERTLKVKLAMSALRNRQVPQ